MIYLTCTYFLEGIGRPLPGMIAMLIANFINAAFNWVFIFGHLGFSPMGAAGSALATTVTRTFLAIFMFTYVWKLKDHEALGIRNKALGSWRDWRKQRHVGYGAGVSLGLEVSSFTTLNIFAGWIGTLALGAFSITFSMFALAFMVASGIGNAAAVRVGMASGRKDYADLVLAGWTGLGVNTLVMLPFVLLFLTLPVELAGGFTDDTALIATTAPLVALSGWLLVLDGGQTVMGSALRGRGETWAPPFLYAIAYYGVMIPLAWYLAFPMGRGVNGLFEAMIAASVVSLSLFATRFHILSRHDLKKAADPA
jgi:MATE family multidrug resistance protein